MNYWKMLKAEQYDQLERPLRTDIKLMQLWSESLTPDDKLPSKSGMQYV